MIYHLIKIQKNNLQRHFDPAVFIRVLESPYKKKILLCSKGGIFEKRKIALTANKKKPLKQTTAEPKKKRKKAFLSHWKIFHPYKPKSIKKKSSFLIFLLLNIAFKPKRGRNLKFQAKITTKTVKILWRKNQYCIHHLFFYSFLLLCLI